MIGRLMQDTVRITPAAQFAVIGAILAFSRLTIQANGQFCPVPGSANLEWHCLRQYRLRST